MHATVYFDLTSRCCNCEFVSNSVSDTLSLISNEQSVGDRNSYIRTISEVEESERATWMCQYWKTAECVPVQVTSAWLEGTFGGCCMLSLILLATAVCRPGPPWQLVLWASSVRLSKEQSSITGPKTRSPTGILQSSGPPRNLTYATIAPSLLRVWR